MNCKDFFAAGKSLIALLLLTEDDCVAVHEAADLLLTPSPGGIDLLHFQVL